MTLVRRTRIERLSPRLSPIRQTNKVRRAEAVASLILKALREQGFDATWPGHSEIVADGVTLGVRLKERGAGTTPGGKLRRAQDAHLLYIETDFGPEMERRKRPSRYIEPAKHGFNIERMAAMIAEEIRVRVAEKGEQDRENDLLQLSRALIESYYGAVLDEVALVPVARPGCVQVRVDATFTVHAARDRMAIATLELALAALRRQEGLLDEGGADGEHDGRPAPEPVEAAEGAP